MKQGKPSLGGVQPSLLSARAENMSRITSTENADCKSRLVSVHSPLHEAKRQIKLACKTFTS